MPHCILEYSDNIVDKLNFRQIIHAIHSALMETNLFILADIKTRVIKHTVYLVGDGDSNQAFVTLTIQILAGREDSLKKQITEKANHILSSAFKQTLENLDCSITVQIVDIHKPSYQRRVSYQE